MAAKAEKSLLGCNFPNCESLARTERSEFFKRYQIYSREAIKMFLKEMNSILCSAAIKLKQANSDLIIFGKFQLNPLQKNSEGRARNWSRRLLY